MLYFWANLGFAGGKIRTVVIPSHFGFGGTYLQRKKQGLGCLAGPSPRAPATASRGSLSGIRRPSGRRLLAVRLEPRLDQRDLRVDRGMAQPLLPSDELHQLVGALDGGGAVLQRARRRGRPREALRRGGIFLERHEIVRLGAELEAEVEHEIVDRARGLDVAVDGFLGGPDAVLGDAAIVA